MKKLLTWSIILLLFTGCGKKSDSPPETPPDTPPGKSTLLLPESNSICTTGTVLSASQSTISFSWTAATGAESYDLVIKNLLTTAIKQQTTAAPQAAVTLDRNTPYSWYVVSKTSKTSKVTQSDVFKFYSAGISLISYAPFPADVVSPENGGTLSGTTANLAWKGSSTDNNIVSYDIYFGTTASPTLFKSNVTDMFLNNVTIAAGNLYYWRVITRDANSNTSSSDVFQFKVK